MVELFVGYPVLGPQYSVEESLVSMEHIVGLTSTGYGKLPQLVPSLFTLDSPPVARFSATSED